jgi:hypothetical protein
MCAFVPLHRIALEPPWLRLYGMHLYEVRPHKDKRGVDLISDALPFSAGSRQRGFKRII